MSFILWVSSCNQVVNVNWQIASAMCMFEAQEDQSDSSQQATASDEDKGTVNQVLTTVTADKMSVGLLAASWAISISYS